ncbi:MAG: hypothetical protein A2918_01210 [Candidatus Yanofskybacteria bacterium RIFCSPLOWO2_01_FULL_42_49]|uniref:Uncharacterized protein n=1 Tax=Candidatus Yanofskybacteria bacterium RIFCSPLOWO2_01_FULL_42_49 TaxID=1802694 RepID=A0A1F8GE32_9BACT|nr:MAG: hypothetical protein A2918_01210 [Candidatus Yanofskybacteria bacterium RIFCSPLOWO2_01_FULL_42_49]
MVFNQRRGLCNKSAYAVKSNQWSTGYTKSWAEHKWSIYEGRGVNEDKSKRRNLVFLQVARYSHKEFPIGSFLFDF